MSLQLWLPLRGNLENLGLKPSTVTSVNLTSNANGKIGNCYAFNGSSSYILATEASCLSTSVKEWSFCCWAKLNANNVNHCLMSQRTSVNASQRTIFLVNGKGIYVDDGDRYNTTLNTTADQFQWCHYAIVRKTNNITIYVNGIVAASSTWTAFPSTLATTYFMFGASQNGESTVSGNVLNGYMNDVRIYDHALSLKEIKAISKALVCHYPLDGNFGAMPNLLKNSNFLQGTGGFEGWNINQGATATKQTDCMKVVGTNANAGIYTFNYDTITTGDTVTFSAWVKADAAMTVYIGTDGSGNGSCQAYDIGTEWQRISITKAKTENNPAVRIYGNGTFYVKMTKYEFGSKVTPYIPNIADSISTNLGLQSTQENDISGYRNHGTKNAVTIVSDSPRYSCATKFDGSTSFIACGRGGMVKDEITLNVWAYMNDWSTVSDMRIVSCTEVGGWCIGYVTDALRFYCGTGTTSNTYKTVTAIKNMKTLSTGWHMFSGTYNGLQTKIYIDGVLDNTLDGYTTKTPLFYNSNNGIFIGAEASGNQTTPISESKFPGNISDVRIYGTALSADDIKELYEVSAQIDNDGNLYANDFVEV